jgi:hypothetical protein
MSIHSILKFAGNVALRGEARKRWRNLEKESFLMRPFGILFGKW